MKNCNCTCCPVKQENALLRQRIAIAASMCKTYHNAFGDISSNRYATLQSILEKNHGSIASVCTCNI